MREISVDGILGDIPSLVSFAAMVPLVIVAGIAYLIYRYRIDFAAEPQVIPGRSKIYNFRFAIEGRRPCAPQAKQIHIYLVIFNM